MRKSALFLFLFTYFLTPALFAEQLVIISPHWEGIRYEFENAYAKWRKERGLAELSISWRDIGGTSEIVRFVQSEFQGKVNSEQKDNAGIGVDLVFGGGIDPFETFKKLGILSKLDINPLVLSRVASEIGGIPLYDSEHYWFAPTMSAFGIFCNQKVLSTLALQAPQGWEDLLAPDFATWITSADPRRSGSAHMFYEIILQAYGWERGWQVIFGLAKNYRTFLANSSQAILDVVHGEVACSFAIDSQANAQITRFPKGQFVFSVPKSRSLFNGDGIAVLSGAPNFEAARSFVEFSLSVEAQRLLYLPKGSTGGPSKYELNRLPVLPELFEDPELKELNPFKELSNESFKFDSGLSSGRWEAINDLLGIFVIESKDAARLENKKCQAAFPKEQEVVAALNAKVWENPIERNNQISEWRGAATECEDKFPINFNSVPALLLLALLILLGLKKISKP